MSGTIDKGQKTTGEKKTPGEVFSSLMEKVLCGMGKVL